MNDTAFSTIRVDDGRIVKVLFESGAIRVFIRDWQGHSIIIEYVDVIGIEALNLLSEELSGILESTTDPLIDKFCSLVDEPSTGFKCYCFLSAWHDRPLLRIVARAWRLP